MKKLYFSLLTFLFLVVAQAQIVNIPDAYFKTRLLTASAANNIAATGNPDSSGIVSGGYTTIDTNGDGEIQVSEAMLIKKLDLGVCSLGMQIQNLSGIEAFTNLVYLGISCNNLSDLSLSNPQLKYIEAQNINFQTVDFSQLPLLTYLRITGSSLTTIDFTNNYFLNNVQLPYNLGLEYIFMKNTSIFFPVVSGGIPLGISNNTALKYICVKDSEIAKMKQHFASSFYGGIFNDLEINSYCSFVPSGVFYNINGNLRLDNNLNGCDASDSMISNLKFNITDGTVAGSLISNALGNYFIPVAAGTYTITPQFENPNYFSVSPTNAVVSFPTEVSPFVQNFCIAPNGVHHDLEVVVIPLDDARPGFDATYKIKYKNKGNLNETATVNFNYNEDILDFVSTSVASTTQNAGLLCWDLGTIAPFQTGEIIVTLNVNSPMETPAVNAGDNLKYSADIVGLTSDETIDDNTFILNQIVVNSFDPNDKTCLEGTTIDQSIIGKFVHYKIRFENTGTFPAQNIVVKDLIDTTKFDLSTLQMTDASHSCFTRIDNTNKVEFIFENINLPFDDANNDGYVVFKIKTKPTLTVNSTISNVANIYFDYNFPIVTNTATSTFQVLKTDTFAFDKYFTIYPNPVKNELNLSTKQATTIYSLSIYNILGQQVQTTTNPEKTIDVTGLKTGNYIVKVITDKGVSSSKFVKE